MEKISLPHQKNVVKFFRAFDIAQIVIMRVNQSKFLVNSIILSLHSPVFEDMIYSGAEEIVLDDSLQFHGAEMMVNQCLLFLHGDELALTLSHIPNLYHFATVYKIVSMQEQCEKAFAKLLTNCDEYVKIITDWSCGERRHWYKGLVVKNSQKVVKLLTTSENLITILQIVRSESCSHNSLIPSMLPCQEMLGSFYLEMSKRVTEPSDAIKLNLIKKKYHGSTVYDNNITKELKPLMKEKSLGKADATPDEITEDPPKQIDMCRQVETLTSEIVCNDKDEISMHSQESLKIMNGSSDRKNDQPQSSYSTIQGNDLSLLATSERKVMLSLLFADIISLVQTIQQNNPQNYIKMDIALTWMFLNKYKVCSKEYSQFCSSFNNKVVSNQYVLDVKQVLSNCEKSNRVIKLENNEKGTVTASSPIISLADIKKQIQKNGCIVLQDTACPFTSCEVNDHRLNLFVLLKKNYGDSAAVRPCTHYSSNIHSADILHFYLLALNKELFVENIVSIKVMTKSEILLACSNYPRFVLRVIYKDQQAAKKSKLSVKSNSSNLGIQEDKNCERQESVPLAEPSEVSKMSKELELSWVFLEGNWRKFSYSDLVQCLKMGCKKQEPSAFSLCNNLWKKSDFVYLCIDAFFSLVHFGKLTLDDGAYRSLICSFEHSLISAEFIKDLKTIFNSALPKRVPVMSKSGCHDSFLVTVSLEKKHLQDSIKNNGVIYSGVVKDQCKMTKCSIENHNLNMVVHLNKSENDLTATIRCRTANSSPNQHSHIHRSKILHFYLIALNSKDEAVALISLKLLPKSDILRYVKRYSKFKLHVIYSNS